MTIEICAVAVLGAFVLGYTIGYLKPWEEDDDIQDDD